MLTNLKNVQSFGVHNTLQPLGSLVAKKKKKPSNGTADVGSSADDSQAPENAEEEQVVVSTLVVGCRKKVAVISWSGGKPLGGTKVSLPSLSNPFNQVQRLPNLQPGRTSPSPIPRGSSSSRLQRHREQHTSTSPRASTTSSVSQTGHHHRQHHSPSPKHHP